MDIGYLTTDAARYSSKNWKKVLTLGILFVMGFLIIPAFLFMGYVFRVLKWSIKDVNDLPDYDNWGEMLIDGFKVFLVQLIYFIIPFIIIFGGMWASVGSLIVLQDAGATAYPTTALSFMGGTFILGLVVTFIFGVFFTIGLADMAYNEGELKAAFQFREIMDMISKIGWVDFIVWYVVMIIVGSVMGFVASILILIPVLGWALIMLILFPYLYLLFARALGLLFISGFKKP